MNLFRKKEKKLTEQEKVDERRAEVLSRGRKFKYPLQWTKHRVVINTIIIATVVVGIVAVTGWLALYRFGMTDDLLYRTTRFLPVSVATVDGAKVRFSDYLMIYRSSIMAIERQSGLNGDDDEMKSLRADYKRAALVGAEEFAYARKMAQGLGIEVSREEIANEFLRHLSVGGTERSEQMFLKIVNDNFGLDKSEYEHMLEMNLIKMKVAEAIDEEAARVASEVEWKLLENGGNFAAVAEALGDAVIYEETGGMVSAQNIDGGRAARAMELEAGERSDKFISMNGDGYYFVKLIEKNETEVNFVSIRVPFMALTQKFAEIKEQGKITEYIELVQQE